MKKRPKDTAIKLKEKKIVLNLEITRGIFFFFIDHCFCVQQKIVFKSQNFILSFSLNNKKESFE